jgi:hypothetical protein
LSRYIEYVYGYPPNLPPPHLAYASGGAEGRVGESGFGITSVVTCLVMVVCSMAWSYGLTRLTGLALLPLVFAGIPILWIGCGFGFVMGMVGMIQKSRGQRWAKHGMWLNCLVGFVPIIVLQITTSAPK